MCVSMTCRKLAHRLSDLAFDHLNVQGTVDGPNPWFGVQINGEWFRVEVTSCEGPPRE